MLVKSFSTHGQTFLVATENPALFLLFSVELVSYSTVGEGFAHAGRRMSQGTCLCHTGDRTLGHTYWWHSHELCECHEHAFGDSLRAH